MAPNNFIGATSSPIIINNQQKNQQLQLHQCNVQIIITIRIRQIILG
jgi:hypothetical protein